MLKWNKNIKVDAAIVGFQKCGTSALHQFLSSHPDIIVSNPKETHFFATPSNFSKGEKYYHSFFKIPFYGISKKKVLLDSSPSYSSILYQDYAIPKMYTYNPSFKIICMVRNPVHRAFSAWHMYRNRFKQDPKWFQKLETLMKGECEKMIERTNEEFDSFDLYVENELKAIHNNKKIEGVILPQGLYNIGIKNLKNHFDNCLFIDNDDMQHNTPKYLEMVSSFLGVSKFNWNEFDGLKFFEQNYKRSINSRTKERLEEYYKESDEQLRLLTGISYF